MKDLPSGFDAPRPISVTFIPASVFDNPALLQVSPEYVSWLRSLPLLECERLLAGNWKIRPAGFYFKRECAALSTRCPAVLDHIIRYWDRPATEKTEFNDPDWTVGIKLGRDRSGGYWPLDIVRRRANPGDVEQLRSILPGRTATDPHWIRPGPGTGRQEPDAPSPCPRPRRPATS
jgi:hypothetical protein